MAAIQTVWVNVGDVPDTEQVAVLYRLSANPSGVGHVPGYLQSQIHRALMMNVLQQECGILCSSMLPPPPFGLLMAILAPYVSHYISDIMMVVTSLEEAESLCQQKAVCSLSEFLCFLIKQHSFEGN